MFRRARRSNSATHPRGLVGAASIASGPQPLTTDALRDTPAPSDTPMYPSDARRHYHPQPAPTESDARMLRTSPPRFSRATAAPKARRAAASPERSRPVTLVMPEVRRSPFAVRRSIVWLWRLPERLRWRLFRRRYFRAMKKKLKVGLFASALSLALMVGSVPAYASEVSRTEAAAPVSIQTVVASDVATRLVPQRDLGPCWAQAGRLVGGFFGSIGASIANPWWGAAAWAGYLGSVAQEPRTANGDFAC